MIIRVALDLAEQEQRLLVLHLLAVRLDHVVGMAVGRHAGAGRRRSRASRAGSLEGRNRVAAVVAGGHLVDCTGQLCRTPRLIDAQVGDDIWDPHLDLVAGWNGADEERIAALLQESLAVAVKSGAMKPADTRQVMLQVKFASIENPREKRRSSFVCMEW